MFSGFSLIATVFMYVYIKETKGLTDREKKSIYYPADIIKKQIIDSAATGNTVSTKEESLDE